VPLLVILCLLLVAPGPGEARAAGDALQGLLAELRTFDARFEQTVEDERGRPLETSHGRFYLQRPDRFRWSYTAPYVQEIVSDGEEVWVYDSELAQVTVRSARQALANAPGLLLSAGRPLDEEFEVKELGPRDGVQWFELSARSADAPFRQVRVGLQSRGLVALELLDAFGQTTRLRFRDGVRNPRLDPSLFLFEVPAGVDVIRDQGGGG
jgi:outer membrane lipoprotein carrier protein